MDPDVQIPSAEERASTDAGSPGIGPQNPKEDIPAATLHAPGPQTLNSLPFCLPWYRHGREARPGTVRQPRRFPVLVAPPRRGPIVAKR